MEIELSEDLQHYKESIAMGLNAKAAFMQRFVCGRRNQYGFCCFMIRLELRQAAM